MSALRPLEKEFESTLLADVPPKSLHVGIILDGNRRYAAREGKTKLLGHRAGADNVHRLISEWAQKLGITELTLYAFSMQNFARDLEEVTYLMKLIEEFFVFFSGLKLKKMNVRVEFIGRRELFSESIQNIMSKVEDESRTNTGVLVRFAMAYGGREEICDAVTKVVELACEGKIVVPVTPEVLSSYMYTSSEPDLIIRSGGERRTSNFLMWQSWYSEWFFVEKFWPEFSFDDLNEVVRAFSLRERRFGK